MNEHGKNVVDLERSLKHSLHFQSWFKRRVPAKAVDLDSILTTVSDKGSRGPMFDERHAYKIVATAARDKKKVHSCGTVGCVLGWAEFAYFPMIGLDANTTKLNSYFGVVDGFDELFATTRLEEKDSGKKTALARLRKHIALLRKAIREERRKA